MYPLRRTFPFLLLAVAGCGRRPAPSSPGATEAASPGATLVVHDTMIQSTLEVSGIAAPVRTATLSTTLMGSVTDVLVHEGQHVRGGDILARIDARDLDARGAQASAAVAEADAGYANARVHAVRIRALYADSAATRAQLDDVEAALARAEAGVRAARAAVSALNAARAYADIRAPFDGIITRRSIDPGSFVTTGAPLLVIEDGSRLRLSVTVTPADVRGIARGATLDAQLEGQPLKAVVEGIVPAGANGLYIVNALVDNAAGKLLPGGSGTLLLPRAPHAGILLSEAALVREGDLTGTRVRTANGKSELRWLQVTRIDTAHVEVLSGLHSGEIIELGAPAVREP